MTKAAGAGTTDPIVLRLPIALRIYVIVFMCFWCGVVLTGALVLAVHGSPAAVFPVLMFAFGLTLGYRVYRVSLRLEPDELVVRNYFRTRRVRRGELEGIRAGAMNNQPFMRTIYLLLRDRTLLPIDVAGRPYFRARGQALLDQRLNDLQKWFDRR